MFKRPHTSKTSTPLRSSDLRKLRDEITAEYHLSSSLTKTILPDGLTTTKSSTHLDEPVTIFSAPNGDPRLFRVGKGNEGALVPTIYALDLAPDLLPVLVTAPQVVEHLVSGAALFLKGVSERSLENLPDSMQEGSMVGIAAGGTIVAVGQLTAPKKELVGDKAGKAAITLHARGDFLWASGTGESADAADAKDSAENDKIDSVAKDFASSSITENETQQPETSSAAASSEMTPAKVDVMLRTALLLAIRTNLSKNSSIFPIPASSLYSNYILPYRPANCAPSNDIKKSSSKKLVTLIKACTKSGWISSKEVKNELMIMAVNAQHADVQAVRSYKTLAQAAAHAPAANTTETASANSSAPKTSGAVTVKELFKASSSVLPIFQAVQHERPPSDLYLAADLKKLLLDYVTSNSLVHPRDQKFIQPDLLLKESLLKKGEDFDILSKEDALKRFKDACQNWYSLERAGKEIEYRKGTPPVIKVSIKNVGKRQVTLISNHEAWEMFDSDEFADELKLKSASSTAVTPIAGSAKKSQIPKTEIMCQGTHDALVTKLLIAKGVPKPYIQIDLTKSKK